MPNTADGRLSAEKLKELARPGAEQALKRLRAQIVAIVRTFPDLTLPRPGRASSIVKESWSCNKATIGSSKQVSPNVSATSLGATL
jgi:hypothetical protein